MNAYDILKKKRDGEELSSEEIRFLIRGITEGSVPDYQISAWLMAVFLRGMNFREMRDLTLHIRDSGRVLDLTSLGRVTLDKHSTGGVGDKTTLVVVPMLAACGVPMLKMSGRGLGHSGGTIDKLEAIPGFRTALTVEEALAQTKQIGAALIGQSAELAPADKLLYGLRDVTATVESIPLIASSVMSKKLAAGASRILLDVKVGRGAFMKTLAEAEQLARALVNIGNGVGIPTRAVLTAMEEPLGVMVGNALEIEEALWTLQGDIEGRKKREEGREGVEVLGIGSSGIQEGSLSNTQNSELRTQNLTPNTQHPTPETHNSELNTSFRTLCIELTAHGLELTGVVFSMEEGRLRAEDALLSGAAADKFAEIVAAQGGPATCDAIRNSLPKAPRQHAVLAESEGVVSGLDALEIGLIARDMGGGRAKKEDAIDPAVGVELCAKIGTKVETGQPLAVLHLRADDKKSAKDFAVRLRAAYTLASRTEAPESNLSPVRAVLS